MDYLKHFNLSDRPFKNTYDGRFFYCSYAARGLLDALVAPNRPSLIHLKADSKLGKTTILRRLNTELREKYKVTVLLNPQMTLEEILRQALTDFSQTHLFDSRTPEEVLLSYFQDAITEFIENGQQILLAVDSVESLSGTMLDELYSLMTLEASWQGKFVLLLSGIPDVPWPLILENDLEPHEFTLSPLSAEETTAYVTLRLKAASGAMPFSPRALKALWETSGGVPEIINQVAERSLIATWSAGRHEVTPAQIKAAQTSLDKPFEIDYQALERAGQAPGRVKPTTPKSTKRLRPLLLLAALGLFAFLIIKQVTAPGALVEEPLPLPPIAESAPATTTPAGDNSALEEAGVTAPSLPTPPPQILALPQSSLALVINQDRISGRLWQGDAKGPGLKAEVAVPKFQRSGLFLIGRPRAEKPLVFQFPPSRQVPLEEAKTIWPRVATLLPQDVLPLVVGTNAEFDQEPDSASLEQISQNVSVWVRSQARRTPDDMAALYASSFQFFELGQPPLEVKRENFRQALNSEANTSGEVNLAISQPLILQDPSNDNLVWALFNLKYESNLRNDMGLRLLIFEKNVLGQGWQIVAELWFPERSLRANQ